MTSMTVYDIEIIRTDKSVDVVKDGPYFGSYTDKIAAEEKADECRLLPDVFIVRIMQSSVMG